ncbi:MAG: septum formation initiator family protein [Actinobacteria bacterium]|nr:septum formation initiator family protein [Actinomycetota bacterium]
MPRAAAAPAARPSRSRPQRRIRPAPGPRGSRKSSIQWDRVGRVALLVVLGAIVLLYIPPIAHWIQQSQTAGRERAQVRALVRERARLRAQLRAMTGPGALERQARELGMVKPGERPYIIVPRR